MVNTADIYDVLETIPDPEMPISITDLGLIEDIKIVNAHAHIKLLPTFIGCFALPAIAEEIKMKVGEMSGIDVVDVELVNTPAWNVDRITNAGRASLAKHGISVPENGPLCGSATKQHQVEIRTSTILCPWCNSAETKLTSHFGPTRCKSIHFCDACRQPFERMKRV